ncbi:MAG: HAMP domain-containing histidine kinase [Clostridiaceae bacterium]|nr:HAMP domain-containing histidine kinase [Clostridiaceae bacterium]MBW4859215.1 HAMP domain-containing histidine kinase [Clostridiaceae bacterium]MBW4868711.1 HAMP domain-containing histidine kinase [Clostridiaceae bacterium]
MKNRLYNKSLKFKLWLYFILFTAIIMTILWFLQIVFLNTYYKSMKTNEIKKIGNALVSEYGKEDFADIIYSTSFKRGIIIQILNEKGELIVTSIDIGELRIPRAGPIETTMFIEKLLDSKDGKVLYTVDNLKLGSPTVVYGAILRDENGEDLYLYINGLLDPIDSTTSVLKNQLIIVTILSSLLAIGLSFIIASKVSKPITRVTKSASRLARGDYDVIFEGGDYIEINQLADTLNYATKELSKTEALRRDFIANVSHDLKTPLTLIKSYGEMIRDISGNIPEKRNSHVKVIIDESDRLTELVNDILKLSQLQSGVIQMEYTTFDIGKITENILNRFQVLVERDNYTFNFNYDKETLVIGDENKIEQVIYNLISNAIYYTGEDKLVTINIKNLGEYAKFEVQDTGQGISNEEIDYIWNRYYKLSKNHSRAVIGTGLGLSIVKGILEAHNVEFGIDSTFGKGSKFWFQLKIK